jgi:CDP-glycerol glycerophosphotransferase
MPDSTRQKKKKKKKKSQSLAYLRSLIGGWLEKLTEPTAFLSRLVPKKKRLLVFYPLFGKQPFSGNAKEVFLWFKKHAPEYHCVWLCTHKTFGPELQAAGYPAPSSLWNVFYILRADYLVLDTFYPISHGFPPFSLGRFRIIQLWHGTGYKEIGFKSTFDTYKAVERDRHPKQIRFIPAGSKADQRRLKESFLTDAVFVTGLPRNDLFYRPENLGELRKQLSVFGYSRIILYAPTFRKGMTSSPLDASFWQSLQAWLSENNTLFLVKRHYAERALVVPTNCSHIRDMTAEVSDTQELLALADVLVTDYSSIATDYSITRKPIVFFIYDFEEYIQQSRGFYYDIHEVLPGPFVKTASELIDALKDMSWFETTEHQEKYQLYRRCFHEFNDGGSTERVCRKMLEVMSGGNGDSKNLNQL